MLTPRIISLLTLILSFSASAAPLVLGHRGCRAVRPENTIAAMEYAWKAGADVLELDAVVTLDNELVVHHDLDLKGAPVRTLTLAQVKAYDASGGHHPQFPRQQAVPGEKIPTLDEAFDFARRHKARLMLETKMAPDGSPNRVDPRWFVEQIAIRAKKHGVEKQLILQSFDHRTLAAMREFLPDLPLVLLNPAKHLEDYIAPARALGPQAIQMINFRVIERGDVETLHKAGIQVYSGTTDDRGQWKRLTEIGVDAILTDDPEALLGQLGRGQESRRSR